MKLQQKIKRICSIDYQKKKKNVYGQCLVSTVYNLNWIGRLKRVDFSPALSVVRAFCIKITEVAIMGNLYTVKSYFLSNFQYSSFFSQS